MTQVPSGDFDRRLVVQVCTVTPDAANDPIATWAESFRRWAMKQDVQPIETVGAGQVIRTIDTAWVLRWDSESRLIAPETHRFVWRDRVYEIVGVAEVTHDRMDALRFTCCSRPDLRGDAGPIHGET